MNWSRLRVYPGQRVRCLSGVWEGEVCVVRQRLGHGVMTIAREKNLKTERVYDVEDLRAIGWEPRPWPILLAEGGAITFFAIGVWELMWWVIGR